MNTYEAVQFARGLRKNSTESEKVFWEIVRKRRILGLKFLRQYKIEHSVIFNNRSYFFVDFYCHELKLIIEIDGEIHLQQKEYDQMRQNILESMGYKVYRILNKHVTSETEINKFVNYCQNQLNH